MTVGEEKQSGTEQTNAEGIQDWMVANLFISSMQGSFHVLQARDRTAER